MDQSADSRIILSHRLMGYGVHESAVRVESTNDVIQGAGVAITPRHIASCAHVVLDVLELQRDQVETPRGVIRLIIRRDGREHALKINRFIAWSPVVDFDLVIMELPEEEPDLLPACLEIIGSDQWQRQPVEAFGFPDGCDKGQVVSLVCQMAITDERIQCRPQREGISRGYSGGPVFLAGKLIGLGRSRRLFDNPGRQYDFIVPAKCLLDLAPALTRVRRQPFFDLQQSITKIGDLSAPGRQFDSECLARVRKNQPHTVEEYRLQRLARDYDTADIRLDFTPLLMLLDDKRQDSEYGEGKPPKPLDNLNQALDEAFSVFLLKGAPGAGKTTLLKRLALDCAIDESHALLPVFVELAAHRGSESPEVWLRQQWQQVYPEMPAVVDLARGHTILWLLDGLNELPDETDFTRVDKVDSWRRWLDQQASRHRVIISCRSADYLNQLQDIGGSPVPHLEVQPLDGDKIAEFLNNRSDLSETQAHAAIEHIRKRGLENLYNTPLMLTLLEQVLTPQGDFPDGRADLFAAYLFKLVLRELQRTSTPLTRLFSDLEIKAINNAVAVQPSGSGTDKSAVRCRLILRSNPLFDALSTQAYERQRAEFQQERQEVSFDVLELRDSIVEDYGAEQGNAVFNAALALSLLVHGENEATLRFRHQQFQEFFAARRLLDPLNLELAKAPSRPNEFRVPLDQVRAAMKPWQELPSVDRSGWEETVLLAAELTEDRDKCVAKLAVVNLPLAGQCADKTKLSAENRELLATQLLTRMRDGSTDLRARIAAGLALGDMHALEALGYRRLSDDQGQLVAWQPPLAAVPKGRYTFGSSDDPEAYDNETRFDHELDAFQIGVHPVTNAEWGCFIAAGGYTESRWWVGEASRAFFQGHGTNEGQAQGWILLKKWYDDGILDEKLKQTSYEPDFQEQIRDTVGLSPAEWKTHLENIRGQSEKITQPLFWSAMRYNNPMLPVVGVSFFEAAAYCCWLSDVIDCTYTLPNELEWEAAARGQGLRPRIYAYGDELRGDACNIREASAMVGAPTPVGLYEMGKSPVTGVYDLTGNTWDWTRSGYKQTPPYDTGRLDEINDASQLRVLRGGSWNNIQRNARAAYRNNNHPDNRNNNIGFRVCCAHLVSMIRCSCSLTARCGSALS